MKAKRKPKSRSARPGQSPAGRRKAAQKKATGGKKGDTAPGEQTRRPQKTTPGYPVGFPPPRPGEAHETPIRPKGKNSDPEGNTRPRKSTETPGGLRQTSLYLRPEEFEALYQRAAEETAARGVRVSIGEIMRKAIRAYLKLDSST